MEIDEDEEEEKNMNKQLDAIHNNLFKIDQKIMNIWYRKTVVNQFQTNNKILKKLSNNDNFCEHILSSVDKNMETLRKKTQKYNNNDLNLLGRKRLSAEEYEYDKEIFNDNDFYNFLLKEFLLNNEKEIDDSNYVEKRDENGLVEGRYDLTMRYILNKNNKIKKNVDTKASKNRKIRYDKHEEIINFMVPEINFKEISGRNIIINSLFGTKKLNINLDNNENTKEEEEKREAKKLAENDIELI
jgi:protein AATF/BFR2